MKPIKPNAVWQSRTRHDLIIEVWEALDCESVGAQELEQIQKALRAKFGDGAMESPAAIARAVADEGAVLRHPEVFACDSNWRERVIAGAQQFHPLSFSNLADASESIRKLESWRSQLSAQQGKQKELNRIKEFVLKSKRELQFVKRSAVVDPKRRIEAGEIIQWLTIWMQDPAIFEDWLDLRKRSPKFVEEFGDDPRNPTN